MTIASLPDKYSGGGVAAFGPSGLPTTGRDHPRGPNPPVTAMTSGTRRNGARTPGGAFYPDCNGSTAADSLSWTGPWQPSMPLANQPGVVDTDSQQPSDARPRYARVTPRSQVATEQHTTEQRAPRQRRHASQNSATAETDALPRPPFVSLAREALRGAVPHEVPTRVLCQYPASLTFCMTACSTSSPG